MCNQYSQLWQKITTFYNQKQWLEVSAEALEQFLGQPINDQSLVEQKTIFKFYEWFVWDYRMNGKKNERQVFDYFLDNISSSLTPEEQTILRDWRGAWLSLYQITKIRENEADMINALTGDRFTSICWDESLQVGDIFLGRWVSIQDELSRPTPSIVQVPRDTYTYLQKRIEYAYTRYCGSISNFCRDNGCFFEQWMTEINLIVQKNTLVYEVLDFRTAIRCLKHMREFTLEDEQVLSLFGPLAFQFKANTGKANLILDQDELVFSTNSSQIAEQGKRVFTYSFASCLQLLEERLEDQGEFALSNEEVAFSFTWRRSIDLEVAQLLASKLAGRRMGQLSSAIKLWYDFCTKYQPSYRKAATWAAAVDYAILEIDAHPVDKVGLQQKYNVSRSSLINKYKELKASLQLVIGDLRYSTLMD